ncbi:MAG: hypothetical protein R2830_08655 [Saprospiraceae bacterium]
MFASEQEMSNQFEKFIRLKFGNAYVKEQSGLFGVPDFIFFAKQEDELSIVSFELKLSDWRRAAKQAFRYKSFSHVSYVVLPTTKKNIASDNIELFRKYKIGLAFFSDNNNFEILLKPEINEPYSTNLKERITKTLAKSRKRAKNTQLLIG